MTEKKQNQEKPKGQNLGYIRISAYDQNPQRQLEGLSLDRVFTDIASGKDRNRKALDQLLDFAREGDTLSVHSMDRLARTVEDLRFLVSTFTQRGVHVFFVQEGLTFTGQDNSLSKLLLSVIGAFAEFERNILRERQREGIALAKKRGVYKGRKPSLTQSQKDELLTCLKNETSSKAALSRAYGISRETLYSYLREAKKTNAV